MAGFQGGYPMKGKFTFRTTVFAAFTALALLSLTIGAAAVQGDKKVRLLDDCEPTTFNAILGDGSCIGNGHTTFAEFIGELQATQDAHKWRNQPSQMHLNVGRPLLIENRGGEVHTFTPVAEFGGGLVDILNALSGNPVVIPECAPQNAGSIDFLPAGAVVPGPTAGTSELPVGITRFQCCIHPWMRTVVEVADHAAPPEQGKPNAHAHH
jgi:hypothetical protein